MKKIYKFQLVLIILMITGFSAYAQEDTLINFNGVEPGTLPEDFTIRGAETSANTVLVEAVDVGECTNNKLVITKGEESSNTFGVYIPLPKQYGDEIHLMFDVTVDQTDAEFHIGLQKYQGPEATYEYAEVIKFSINYLGLFAIFSRDESNNVKSYAFEEPYQAGTTYRVEIVSDFAGNTDRILRQTRVTINGVQQGDGTYQFYNSNLALDYVDVLAIYGMPPRIGNLTIDNIYVSDQMLTADLLPPADECLGNAVNDMISMPFTISPNPVSDYFTISTAEPIKITEIYNLQGQMIKSISNTNKINVSDIEAGIYFCRMHTGSSVMSSKIIIE